MMNNENIVNEKIEAVEKSVMTNKAFGIIGVGCIHSNLNADFSGNPKRYMGEYVASPFSIKFAIRAYMERKGFKVFFKKAYKFLDMIPGDKKDKKNKKKAVSEASKEESKEALNRILPMSLEEKYLSLYKVDKLPKNELEFQSNVFTAIDVMNFGGTFPISGFNSAYTGAVQVNTGINKYDEAETIRDTMGTQFQNANDALAENSSLGSRSILSEGHFFFGFTVDPYVYDFIKKYNDGFAGYTKEAYEAFKEASLYGVSNLNSVSKIGCYNEFALFVELKEGSLNMLTNLNDYVRFDKEDGKNEIDLELVMEQLDTISAEVESIEMYYNPITTTVKYGNKAIVGTIKELNILNKQKIVKK